MNKKTIGAIITTCIILFAISFMVTRMVQEPSPSTDDTLSVKTEVSESSTSSTEDSSDEAIDSDTKLETSDTQKELIKKLSEEGKE